MGIWKRRVCEAGLSDERVTAREAKKKIGFSALECTRKINLRALSLVGVITSLTLPDSNQITSLSCRILIKANGGCSGRQTEQKTTLSPAVCIDYIPARKACI